MNFNRVLTALISFGLLASCASSNQGVPSAELNASLNSTNNAKITVGKKVTATSEGTVILGVFKLMDDHKYADGVQFSGQGPMNFLDTASAIKSAAAYKAMEKSGADVLIAPIYITEVDNYFVYKTVKVTVKAYKGTITSIK
ncbi:MAG: hypothetical protein GY793_05715 [Proteobacteria bacterium]|nr:hypothetical protein [Pseudomonadota bacterium]